MGLGTGYMSGCEESVSAVTATNSVALGSMRIENGKEFRYVYNAGTTAAVGYGVIQSASSAYTVTVSAAVGDRCFGVVTNVAIPSSYYGWVQTRGPAHVYVGGDHASAATGGGLYLIANGAFAAVTTGATGSTWAAMEAGRTLETIGTAQTGSAYLTCKV
jgi:hypothetical protein